MPRVSAEEIAEYIPGLVFSMIIALFGYAVWTQYKPISSLMWSFIFGIAVSNTLDISDKVSKGLQFTSSSLLKVAIALLGLVTSANVWFEVGIGAVNALVIIFVSFLMSITLGKRLGISNRLAILNQVERCFRKWYLDCENV